MLIAVATCFALALAAWPVHRLLGRWTGPLLAIVPGWLAARLLARLPDLKAGPVQESWTWLPGLDVSLAFRLDGLSLLFALLILGIGALVFAYSGAYMAKHGGGGRFFPTLAAFMGSMLGVVLSDNVIALFVFWELTSITSFLLIGFDYEKEKARSAALQAMLVTAGGGLALLAGLLLLGSAAGTMSVSGILAAPIDYANHPHGIAIVLLLAAGAFTKSAQVPFHFWLPGAMVAPTPVSTYLHSATMVKAGVYLLARFQPAFGGDPLWTGLLVGAGLLTVLTGAVMAVGQTDLKRLLAYATVAALGTMVLLIGLGSDYALAALPLYILAHAGYKAALFLVAGLIDMKTGTRDVRELGGLWKKMPVLAAASMLAGLSFAGLPPALGYVAKEWLYKAGFNAHASGWELALAAALVLAKALLFTTAVIVALKPLLGGTTKQTTYAKDGPFFMLLGPVLLAAGSLLAGLYGNAWLAPLLKPAGAAVAGHPVKLDLALWHGFIPPFWLSLATVALGIAGVSLIGPFRRLRARSGSWTRFGPEAGYSAALRGMLAFGHWQTAIIQDGRLRHYVLTVVLTFVALVGGTFLLRGGIDHFGGPWGQVRPYELVLGAIALAGALGTVLILSRLGAVTTLGVAGFAVALTFLVFSGPDLSTTQFAVETLGVILFVFVLYKLPPFRVLASRWERVRDAAVALLTGGTVTLLVLAAFQDRALSSLGRWFAEHSYTDGKGKNVVNVILVDFRALDTLGEITVIAVAALGVFSLMRLRRDVDPERLARGEGLHNLPDSSTREDLEAPR